MVLPETRGDVTLIIAVCAKAFGEEVIGEAAGLFKSIDPFVNLEVDPSAMCVDGEVVLGDELLWDVTDFDANIFWPVKRCPQVEVGDVETRKSRIWHRQGAVKKQFDEFQRSSFGACVAGVAYPVATDGDPGVIWVRLLRSYFADDPCVLCDV